jgi:hypothetical protein
LFCEPNHGGFRERFARLHLSPILLFSSLVLCVPLTWERTLLAQQTPTQLSRYAVALGAFPEAQTHLFSFHGEMPLSFTPNLGQTKLGLRFVSRDAGFDSLLPTNKAVVELAAKANYSIASAPTPWLANTPDNVHHRTVYTRDLHYYGQRVPLVGKTILRIARQADSHPRASRVVRMLIYPPF